MSQHKEATMAVAAVDDEAVAMVAIPMRTFLLRVLKKIGKKMWNDNNGEGRGLADKILASNIYKKIKENF
jgi:hypothetical protein